MVCNQKIPIVFALKWRKQKNSLIGLRNTIFNFQGHRQCVKPGFHLGKPSSGQERTGKVSFVLEPLVSTESSQRKLCCPFPSWGKLSWVKTSLNTNRKYSKVLKYRNFVFYNKLNSCFFYIIKTVHSIVIARHPFTI